MYMHIHCIHTYIYIYIYIHLCFAFRVRGFGVLTPEGMNNIMETLTLWAGKTVRGVHSSIPWVWVWDEGLGFVSWGFGFGVEDVRV